MAGGVILARPEGSFGASVGKAAGSALGTGLNNLIEKKIADLQERQGIDKARALVSEANLPEWLGDILAKDPKTFQSFIKEWDILPPEEKEKVSQSLDNIGLEGLENSSESQSEEVPDRLLGVPITRHAMFTPRPEQKEEKIPGLHTLANAGEGFEREPGQTSNVQSFPELGHKTNGQAGPFESGQTKEPGFTDKKGFRFQRKGKQPLSINPEIENEKLRRDSYKETKEDRKAFLSDYQSAKSSLADLERMEKLEEEGKLDTPGYLQFLERSGFDIPALMNPGSEEFNKIAANFLRDAKIYYGGRVTNQEMEQFLKTVPSLSQSPEGRKRVIANLKNLARVKKERYQAYKDIKQENNGIIPVDIAEQVEDRLDSRLDHLAEQFKKDLDRKVPEGQNKLITALQATLGEAVGRIKPTISGAAKGAVVGAGIGSAGGPIGAGGGALLGGLGGLAGLI